MRLSLSLSLGLGLGLGLSLSLSLSLSMSLSLSLSLSPSLSMSLSLGLSLSLSLRLRLRLCLSLSLSVNLCGSRPQPQPDASSHTPSTNRPVEQRLWVQESISRSDKSMRSRAAAVVCRLIQGWFYGGSRLVVQSPAWAVSWGKRRRQAAAASWGGKLGQGKGRPPSRRLGSSSPGQSVHTGGAHSM